MATKRIPIEDPNARKKRRGAYAVIVATAMATILAMGALAVDVAYMRLAEAQAQDVADAASQAALFMLRRTGSETDARAAAEAACAKNVVAGVAPTLHDFNLGSWDEDLGTFDAASASPNAVQVTVARTGDDAVGLFLGRFAGWDRVNISASATSAARNLHVILVMDITNSWDGDDFYNARDAALAFYDTLAGSHGELDLVGMTVFTNRYGWEFTPMTAMVDDVAAGGLVRADWAAMETASKAGTPAGNSKRCNTHKNAYRRNRGKWNDFTTPVGGCFTDMPREYTDEPGTDHTTGMEMARTMFEEETDDTVYRAMVVLTDGRPNGLGSASGTLRAAEGYTETRWREFEGPVPHSGTAIRNDSVTLAEDLWDDMRVHTFVVSFVADETFMDQMAQGDGYYENTSDSAALIDIFEDIANAMPMAIVQ